MCRVAWQGGGGDCPMLFLHWCVYTRIHSGAHAPCLQQSERQCFFSADSGIAFACRGRRSLCLRGPAAFRAALACGPCVCEGGRAGGLCVYVYEWPCGRPLRVVPVSVGRLPLRVVLISVGRLSLRVVLISVERLPLRASGLFLLPPVYIADNGVTSCCSGGLVCAAGCCCCCCGC